MSSRPSSVKNSFGHQSSGVPAWMHWLTYPWKVPSKFTTKASTRRPRQWSGNFAEVPGGRSRIGADHSTGSLMTGGSRAGAPRRPGAILTGRSGGDNHGGRVRPPLPLREGVGVRVGPLVVAGGQQLGDVDDRQLQAPPRDLGIRQGAGT